MKKYSHLYNHALFTNHL